MGGSGGVIIVRNAVTNTLTNPQVFGSLPSSLQLLISASLAKAEVDWTDLDKALLAHAFSWALCNL
jgi:hypothetical protein